MFIHLTTHENYLMFNTDKTNDELIFIPACILFYANVLIRQPNKTLLQSKESRQHYFAYSEEFKPSC